MRLPGDHGTRLIPDRRDRLATILVLPFMSCSARLPVYVLLTSLLFAGRPALAGLMFAGVLRARRGRGVSDGCGVRADHACAARARPMVLELPSYKWPSITNALITARDQGLAFLKTAGTVIIAICIVMWWLSAYPRSAPPAEAVGAARAGAAPGTRPTLRAR